MPYSDVSVDQSETGSRAVLHEVETDNDLILELPQRRHVSEVHLSTQAVYEALVFHSRKILNSQEKISALQKAWLHLLDASAEDCDNAINTLQEFTDSIQQFCALVDHGRHLPLVIVPLRYSLVVTLHHANDVVWRLSTQIAQIRVPHDPPLTIRQRGRQHQDILRKLEALQREGDDILRHAEQLALQVRHLSVTMGV